MNFRNSFIWKALCVGLVIILLAPTFCLAALTKTETTQALEWTEIAQAGILETGSIDVSDAYSAILHIDCCLSSTTAHTGTEIIVQIASEAGVDDAWTDLTKFVGPVGTAITVPLTGAEAAAQTVLTVTDPVTNNLDNSGKSIFLEDPNTVAQCEIVYVTTNSGDAGDTITILDGLTHAHVAWDDFFDIDSATVSAVSTTPIEVPMATSQARVIFNNNYDADGSTVHVRVRITKCTGL